MDLKLIDELRLVPDTTLDDDNQSDSDEYEYEVIEEIEEVEVDTDELSHADDEPEINTKSHSQHLTISEGKRKRQLPPKMPNSKRHPFFFCNCSRNNHDTRYRRQCEKITRDACRQNGRHNRTTESQSNADESRGIDFIATHPRFDCGR